MYPTIQAEKAPTSTRPRPNSAPAYYLARPASCWITATTRRGEGK